MNSKDYRMNLVKEFVEGTDYIPPVKKEMIMQIAALQMDNMDFLMKTYEALEENERFVMDEELGLNYRNDGEDYILSLDNQECSCEKACFRKVLINLLDLIEDTLPLGTVVDLRKDIYKAAPQVEKIEHIRMVITYRFLGKESDTHYYPYGGVVYPTGMMGEKQILYFTRPLVDKVVHKGFVDEKEDMYVYLMKKDLVIGGNRNSFGYATKEEIEAFNKRIKQGGI